MRALSLDLSVSRTGWAVGALGEKPQRTGTFTAPLECEEGERFSWIARHIAWLAEKEEVQRVIFAEFYHTPNPASARASLGLRGATLAALADKKIPCLAVMEISARKKIGVNLMKSLTPSETADYERRSKKNLKAKPKKDMKARVAERLKELGLTYQTDDEADAAVLLMTAGK